MKTIEIATLKFIYSEKATKFCEISTLLLTVSTVVKSKVEISQNFVAFSEYMNFTINKNLLQLYNIEKKVSRYYNRDLSITEELRSITLLPQGNDTFYHHKTPQNNIRVADCSA